MKNLDILSFPLQGSQLIEASAGTGKTYTIALLYVRLILAHNTHFARALTPADILVVTFTDAATRELVDRIRRRLVDAAEAFSQVDKVVEESLAALRNTYPQQEWPQCALTLQRAAEGMDEAAISTIHSWCQRMLREHAFDAGSLLAQQLVTDDSDLIEEVVQDYWRIHYYPLSTQDVRLIDESIKNIQDLKKQIQKYLNYSEATFMYKDVRLNANQAFSEVLTLAWQSYHKHHQPTPKQMAMTHLQEYWNSHRFILEAEMTALAQNKKFPGYKIGNKDFSEYLINFNNDIQDGKFGKFKEITSLSSDNNNLQEFQQLIITHQQASREKEDFIPAEVYLRLHAQHWMTAEIDRRKGLRSEFGFKELLTHLDAALNPKDVRKKAQAERLATIIREQFPAALIDEFQDTDPIQLRIFDAIYGIAKNDAHSAIIMIGDPKQAIYAFRGADIYTYLLARKATAGRHYQLHKNFRSTQGLIAAINNLYKGAESYAQGAFYFQNSHENPLPYHAVEAHGRDEELFIDDKAVEAMNCWYNPDTESMPQKEYQKEMADVAAQQIAGWLVSAQNQQAYFKDKEGNKRALRPADIAILVRSKVEAATVRAALQALAIPSVYYSDQESIYNSQEAQDFLYILRACAQPQQESYIRAALATITFAHNIEELYQFSDDEILWEEIVLRFRQYLVIWQTQGVLVLCWRILQDFSLVARWQGVSKERQLTNYLHLAELLQQASVQIEGEMALLRYLSEQMAQGNQQTQLRLESDEALVKVITIHGSKGLEYPLVLLPFMCFWGQQRSKTGVVYHDDEGQLMLDMASSKESPEASARKDAEENKENIRLLYVALTRAQHALFLGMAHLKAPKDKPQASALGYLLTEFKENLTVEEFSQAIELCWPHSKRDISAIKRYSPEDLQSQAVDFIDSAQEPRRSAKEHWFIASYSALKTEASNSPHNPDDARAQLLLEDIDIITEDVSDFNEDGNKVATIHDVPKGATAGVFLHSLLEWAAEQGFAKVVEADSWRVEHVTEQCLQQGWQEWSVVLSDWLKRFLQTAFTAGEESLSWQEIALTKPEMEFWYATNHVNTQRLDALITQAILPQQARPALQLAHLNGMLKGFIDLIFEHKGRYYVADWKSNYLGQNNAAYSWEAMAEVILEKRYDIQYSLYLLALHRHLRQRLPDYDYEQHIGGAVYVFLRGYAHESAGIYFDKPPKIFIEHLDALFANMPMETVI
jgi:exodeoxyribonuclease V beta subunit